MIHCSNQFDKNQSNILHFIRIQKIHLVYVHMWVEELHEDINSSRDEDVTFSCGADFW